MLTTARKIYDPAIAMINAMMGGGADKEIETGVYEIGHHNFGNTIVTKNKWPDLTDKDGKWFNAYGVCDNPEQVFETCPMIKGSENKYCVSFTKVSKSGEPSEGGWRWHKWGEYIGSKEPTTEYLHDEPEIDEVYCYHVYEV